MQPMEAEVRCKTAELDNRVQPPIYHPPSQTRRCRKLAKILSLPARREQRMLTTVSRFRGRVLAAPIKAIGLHTWYVISIYNTIHPLIKMPNPPTDLDKLDQFVKFRISVLKARGWAGSSNFKRWIPEGRKLPPALRHGWTARTEKLAVAWYMNRIRRCKALRSHKEVVEELLSKRCLTKDEAEIMEQIF